MIVDQDALREQIEAAWAAGQVAVDTEMVWERTFFPALGAVVMISTGQQITEKSGLHGLILLWGGVALLAGAVVQQYRTLVRV